MTQSLYIMIAVGVPWFTHNDALGIFPISRPSACYLELTLGQPMLKLQCYTITIFCELLSIKHCYNLLAKSIKEVQEVNMNISEIGTFCQANMENIGVCM